MSANTIDTLASDIRKTAVKAMIADYRFQIRALTALQLWIEWFEKDGDPGFITFDEANICFFCTAESKDDGGYVHKPDCVYARAKELLSLGE